ncbi:Aminopeptidase N [Defluviimonas aquaemixtae]|uniref:Aminopeptidase N n=1 Tax=Albidovulum aquaemixtae TaxID=1542388 RepID=A0A2R8B7I6_9RHOB|nr:aminopeptidase N [Defluviimonas aquaemixtae]SPH18591.1 Aminopeptidase N [Defluviimonas aquaemixtae]
MKDAAPQPTLLADYRPYPFDVTGVELTFRLSPEATRVVARIGFAPNPARPGRNDLRLDGEKLKLHSAKIDSKPVKPDQDAEGLTVPASQLPDGPFTWDAEVEIDPKGNTALEGLYMSGGIYCTQCEAEGFRKITYYPDRPDVMAPFKVRIESDLPVLLSNGNPTAKGKGWAEWTDPWPKPAYLFALVAGDLVAVSDTFTTMSGKTVDLNIWVREGDEDRCAYAMDSLIRSMKWDEEVYGREYDLDVFNIVAIDDFNMGAMENKGLNIFNSKLVLASPETATDGDFERIEGVIAHEYFHNWTGDRITCRDWFQLCLKEGLTVFRDQQFTSDMRSEPVKRIEDVLTLRARQFREDMGPLAHPVRPESYIEINNFYTATVYEKGAEVIGMLKRLVGDDGYRKALDLYFERHDGEAATIEDWLMVFEDATGRDLTQFKRWYTDAGTPRLTVAEDWSDGSFTLTFTQKTPPTPGQDKKKPRVIPIAVGLLNPNGDEVVPTMILEMTKATQSFRFEELASRPVPSILRGFSAPVVLDRDVPAEERAFLLAHDTDPFNKWESGRALAKDVLVSMIGKDEAPSQSFIDALGRVLTNDSLDPAFRALCLRMPSEDDLAQTLHDAGQVPDPEAIHAGRGALSKAIARSLQKPLVATYDAMATPGEFAPDATSAGKRALRLACLWLLNHIDNGTRAAALFASADNMTESHGALACLIEGGRGTREIGAFYERWKDNRLVIDKWFMVQVLHAAPKDAAPTAERLAEHPDFEWTNPNRFRALLGALGANHAGFHETSGRAYRFYADWLLKLDPLNPQTTARMSTAFETWSRYDVDRKSMIRAELDRIAATEGLSRDTYEMVTRIRAADA